MVVLATSLLLSCTPAKLAVDTNADTSGPTAGTADTSRDSGGTPWVDVDGDGYGGEDDCDDGDPRVNPGATEVCDPEGAAIDEDCDGLVDDEDDSLDPDSASTWFRDSDGDGYGDPNTVLLACEQPSASTLDDTDCDDDDPAVHPGADELCDGVDNDCDGASDGAITFTGVTSSYVYQGTETLVDLQGEVSASPLLCTDSLPSTASFSGPETCGSGTSDIGYELVIRFFVTEETAGMWSFRLGPDFGRGGALFLDGAVAAQAVDDLWWNYSWNNPAEILEASAGLGPGAHSLHAIGFESCCSGYSALEVALPGSEWTTLTTDGPGMSCAE